MKARSSLAALVLLCLAVALRAEGSAGLAELRTLALARSAPLRSALLGVDSASVDERLLAQELLPSLQAQSGAGASLPTTGTASTSLSASLSLTQPIWDGGKHGIEAAIDSLATAQAKAAAEEAKLSVEEEVDTNYYGVLAARAGVTAAEEDLAAAKDRLTLVEAKLSAGMASRADLLSARSSEAGAETSLASARRDLAVAGAKLSSLTGLASGSALEQVDEKEIDGLAARLALLGDEEVDKLAARLIGVAVASNPSLASARSAEEQATRRIDLAKTANLPTLSASAGQSLAWNPLSGTLSAIPSVGLTASLSIAPWKVSEEAKSYAIAADRAALSRQDSERSIELEIREGLYDAVASAKGIGSDKVALEYAQESYDGVLESYRLSAASVSDLSDAAATLASAKKELIAARYGLLQGLASLRAVSGREDDNLLSSLLP